MGRRIHCCTCGSDNLASAAACWFCGDVVVDVVPDSSVWAIGGGLGASAERVAQNRQFGLAALTFLAVGLCAIAFWLSMGLGTTVTLLVAPALVQTARAVQREEARGRCVTAVQRTGTFVRSLMLGVAARAAGFATFLVAVMMGLAAGKLLALAFGYGWLLPAGGFAGAAVGAVAGFWVAMRINRQRLSV